MSVPIEKEHSMQMLGRIGPMEPPMEGERERERERESEREDIHLLYVEKILY